MLEWAFCEQEVEKGLDDSPFMPFWPIWHEGERIVFKHEEVSLHPMRTSFLFNLWPSTNLYTVDRSGSLFSFLFWRVTDEGWWVRFFVFLFSPLLSLPLGSSVYFLIPLCPQVLLVLIVCAFAYQKEFVRVNEGGLIF